MNLPYLSPNNFWLIAGVLIGAGFTVLGVYVEHRLQIRRDRLKAKAEAEAAEEEKREAIRFAFLAGKNGNVTVRMITEEEGLKTHDLFFLMSDKGVSPNNEQVLKAKEIARATVQRGERGMTESKPSEQYFYQTANNGSPSASNDELTDQSTNRPLRPTQSAAVETVKTLSCTGKPSLALLQFASITISRNI